MFRESIQYLSDSPTIRKLVAETGFSRRLAERFVAGETLDEAIAAAHTLNGAGLMVSLDYLGESVTTKDEAINARDEAIESLDRIEAEELRGNISVKPSQLGLAIDEAFCVENLEQVLGTARGVGDGVGEIFVRLDMESSQFTDATIRLVETLWASGYRNVGTVVQSYLHRALSDIGRLNQLGSRIRLVKGAYNEPPSVAYPDKGDVDRVFVEAMKILLLEGNYPAIATHDEAMIDETRNFAFENGVPRSSFEFQMLYGVRRDLQRRLWEDGYNVRIYVPYGNSWYPYLMRRMAERPANFFFVADSVMKEASGRGIARPLGVGVGVLAGVAAGLAWRNRSRR